MNINEILYGGYSTNSSYGASSVYSTRNTKWRGGVIGWEPKKDSTSSSSSDSSGTSTGVSEYLSSLKKFGSNLSSALASLSGKKQTSIFDMLTGTSSNENVSIKVSDQSKASSFSTGSGEKTLQVHQLASAQKNSGKILSSGDVSNVKTGANKFAIEKDGKTYYFDVNINKSDTNRTVQEKMASAINAADIGIKATVTYSDKDKTSSLVLNGQETGEESEFLVRDAYQGGNLVEEMGVDYVSNKAQNALYTLDGNVKESEKNEDVNLGDGISATFNKVTDGEMKVTAGIDTQEVLNGIYDMINNFNQLRETAVNASSDKGAESLLARLDSLTKAYGTSLKNIGITLNADGYLQADKDKLTEAITNGKAEKALGADSSFTRSLSTIAYQAETDPNRFLSYAARTGKDTKSEFNYEDYLSSANFSTQQMMRLNQLDSMSMLLNMWA